MRLVKPSYKILTEIDGVKMLKKLEEAGRTCYKSEDLISEDSYKPLIKHLLTSNHLSVIEHQYFSVRFICDRGVSHEIVRHRLSSFSQESTRYCNYAKDKFGNQITYIIPEWTKFEEGFYHKLDLNEHHPYTNEEITWLLSMFESETAYNKLIANGWKAQQARSVLPNSLKTEIIVTSNLRQWRTIFEQRCAQGAHPQMRELMIPLLAEINTLIPIIYEDLYEKFCTSTN